jgi:hypothetical protein
MSIIPKEPKFPLKIRPAELVLLSVYLADRSRKEKSSYLRKFLTYVTRIVIEEALSKAFSKTRLEHEREQGEAYLKDFYRGFDPLDTHRGKL